MSAGGGVAAAVLQAMKEMGEDPSGIRLLQCSGGAECKKAMMLLKAGKLQEDFVEEMMCPGGCIGGPSKHQAETQVLQARKELLGKADNRQILENLKNYPMDEFSMFRDGHLDPSVSPFNTGTRLLSSPESVRSTDGCPGQAAGFLRCIEGDRP